MNHIVQSPMLFAAVSPPRKRTGRRWIDYRSCARTAREARKHLVGNWSGGWPDLRKRGWTIERVIVSPAYAQGDQP